jgi:hypothetical protein
MFFPLSGAAGGRLLGGLFACGLVLFAVGCGPDYKARGGVKGRVTVNKKPLTTGTVMFSNKNGVTGTAHIKTDGTYELNDAPVGECQVTVTVPALPMDPTVKERLKGKGAGPKMPEMKAPEGSGVELPSAPTVPKEVVPIDAKYSKPETSGLTITVEKGGTKTFDIDL